MIVSKLYKRFKKLAFYIIRKSAFKNVEITSYIKKPLLITPKCIILKKYVNIQANCRIQGVFSYNNSHFDPEIIFDDYSSSQQNLHLTCANRIYIGKYTAIAANVTITDINHPYVDINRPIEHQDIEVSSVFIGDECKIYNNAVILPGTHIGKHSTIGANSVVNGIFPDYCVIAGVPAKIIKKYNFLTKSWESS